MGTPSNPGWQEGYVPSAAEWNNEWSTKADYSTLLSPGGAGTVGTTTPGGTTQADLTQLYADTADNASAIETLTDEFSSLTTLIFDSRAVAITSDIAAGASLIRTNGYAVAGDGGDALYVRVDADPDVGTGGFQSADGAWWRYVVSGDLRIEQFGGKADLDLTSLYSPIVGTPTDNITPFYDMLKQLVYTVNTDYSQTPQCQFTAGGYYFSTQLEPRVVVNLKGAGGGSDNIIGTIFRFPENCLGMVTNNRATGGGGVITPGTQGTCEGSTVSDIYFLGYGGDDLTKHGLWMRAYAKFIRCTFDNFAGHGIAIIANNASPDPTLVGNANTWYLERCLVRAAGYHGIYVAGVDANAGTSVACQVKSANHAGIVDASGLGNVWINPEIDQTNVAISLSLPGGHAWYEGIGYALCTLDETLGGATTPGTDETIWYPFYVEDAPSAGIPAWVSGATYICGLAIYAEGDSNAGEFIGCYTEGILCDISRSACIMVGGQTSVTRTSRQMKAYTAAGSATYLTSGTGGYRDLSISPLRPYFGISQTSTVGSIVGHGAMNDCDLQSFGCDADSGTVRFQQTYAGDFILAIGGISGGNKHIYDITGPRTARKFGGPVPQPSMFAPVGIGLTSSDLTVSRIISIATSIPTQGTFAQGSLVLNAAPVVGGPTSWICTTAGSATLANWAASTSYPLRALVNNGGKCYISTLAPAWAASTAYSLGDMVSNYGINYVCRVAGTSGTYGPNGPTNLDDGTVVWTRPSGGLSTAWAPSTAYSVGDIRSNGGITYQCTTAGTSAASGGPTGYDAAITDGTVVWAFLGVPQASGTGSGPSGTGSSILDGTIYWAYQAPFVLTPAAATIPYPVPQVVGMSAVAVSHTGDTTETTLATITIPGGLMGANGRIEVDAVFTTTNNANSKSARYRFDGNDFFVTAMTSVASGRFQSALQNRGMANSQVGAAAANQGNGTNASAAVTSAVDTTTDRSITITGQLGNSADTITLESYVVRVIPLS